MATMQQQQQQQLVNSAESTSIASFYAGRSIFITGATGFMGKVLVEKLLRSCPGVREIFLLMRAKKGASIDDRLRKMLSLPLFEKLRNEKPSCFEKLIPVVGDASAEGLGLPPVERRVIIERVSIIFHVAANVRFNEDLKKDIFTNTRSTRDVCILAGSMKNLVALVHVSSTYAHCDKPLVEERMYPAITDWRKIITMVESLDDQTLQIFANKIVGTLPNTYTFSKRLAEQVIEDYSKDIPCVLFRPSIVVSCVEDPIPGWLDNFNGPVGLMIGGGKGILRVVCGEPNISEDFVPVDLAIKAMITATWKRGIETKTKDPSIHVYNCASNDIRRIVTKELVKMALKINEKIPLDGAVWYPNTFLTNNKILHYVMTLTVHLLPALLLDGVLKLSGKPPMLVKIQRRVYTAGATLTHFLHNEWIFRNEKMQKLLGEDVPIDERTTFGYDYTNFDMKHYFEDCLIGAKRYLLHEDMDKLHEARAHLNRMWWITTIVELWMAAVLMWILAENGTFSYFLRIYRTMLDGSVLD